MKKVSHSSATALPLTSPRRRFVPSHFARRTALAAACVLGSFTLLPKADAIVTFVFVYNDAAGVGFNDPAHPEYKQGLETAATLTGNFFANTATVTISVNSTNEPKSSTLASASSPTVSPQGKPGFYRTVVQEKVISSGANDLNGEEPDGDVNVNLGSNFEYNPGAPISAGKIDFVGTMIHELTHALGFTSDLDQTPNTQQLTLTIFDSFLTDAAGKGLVNADKHHFRQGELARLTGGNSTIMDTPGEGGVFFSGPNAKAANGGNPVAIYSPNPYSTGSSVSHLDDHTVALKPLLMAAETEAPDAEKAMAGVTMARSYSPIERGIMTDLGYSLNP